MLRTAVSLNLISTPSCNYFFNKPFYPLVEYCVLLSTQIIHTHSKLSTTNISRLNHTIISNFQRTHSKNQTKIGPNRNPSLTLIKIPFPKFSYFKWQRPGKTAISRDERETARLPFRKTSPVSEI